jgi:RNA polymerase sigma factor (sigma-70 family)
MSEAVSAGEEASRAALVSLYDQERAAMLRLACLLVGSRAIAEEVVQDAFLAVGERWSEIERPGAYLRTAVVNRCRSVLRRRATERRYARFDATVVHAPTELVELRAALGRLPERARAVVVLRYFVDLADADIASVLGCRVATVRSIAHRSLRSLRKELS